MKTKPKKKLAHSGIPQTYAELVALFMPRPLHDEVDSCNALQVLDAMAGFPMNADQADYFDAISTFVEKYESERHAIGGLKLTPVRLIRSLMQEHGMSESDLGRLRVTAAWVIASSAASAN